MGQEVTATIFFMWESVKVVIGAFGGTRNSGGAKLARLHTARAGTVAYLRLRGSNRFSWRGDVITYEKEIAFEDRAKNKIRSHGDKVFADSGLPICGRGGNFVALSCKEHDQRDYH